MVASVNLVSMAMGEVKTQKVKHIIIIIFHFASVSHHLCHVWFSPLNSENNGCLKAFSSSVVNVFIPVCDKYEQLDVMTTDAEFKTKALCYCLNVFSFFSILRLQLIGINSE